MADIIDGEELEDGIDDLDNAPSQYREIRDAEDIPVHTGISENMLRVETGEWDRTGQRGAFINLYGSEGLNDLQIHKIEPGGETKRQHHSFESIVYVLRGSGVTVVGEGDAEVMFEWGERTVFFIPQSTPYKFINTGDGPVRLAAQTPLPLFAQQLQEDVYNPAYNHWENVNDEDFYSNEGTLYETYDGPSFTKEQSERLPLFWVGNFIPDIMKLHNLEEWAPEYDSKYTERGSNAVFLAMPGTSMYLHTSEFDVGRYVYAHHHGPGAHLSIINGTGYSLMWRGEWDYKVKVDWEPGSVFVPPTRWYHQHFNTGSSKCQNFVWHGPRVGTVNIAGNPELEDEIHYSEEDPIVRELFEEELAKRGLESTMPEECYADPDFEF